jgi:hypothetical protein
MKPAVVFTFIFSTVVAVFTLRKKIMKLLVFPRPLLGFLGLKLLNNFNKNEIIEALIKLREKINKTYQNEYDIPICLHIFDDRKYKEDYENSFLKWSIIGKTAVIKCSDNIEEILYFLCEIFPERPLNAVLITQNIDNLTKDRINTQQKIKNLLFKIETITRLKLPFYMVVYHESFDKLDTFISSSIGFEIDNINNKNSLLETFFKSFIYGVNNSPQASVKLMDVIIPFADIDEISSFLNSIDIRGFYLENTFLNLIYSEVVYKNRGLVEKLSTYRFSSPRKILNFLGKLLFIILCGTLIFYKANQSYKALSEFQIGVNMYFDKNNTNLSDAKALTTDNLSIITRYFLPQKYKLIIEDVKKYLIDSSYESINNLQYDLAIDLYNSSPLDTILTTSLNKHLDFLIKSKESIESLKKRNAINEGDYRKIINSIENKTKKLFEEYFQQFAKFRLLNDVNKLTNIIKEADKKTADPSIFLVIRDLIRDLKNSLNVCDNEWWRKGTLGKNFEEIIQKTEKINKYITIEIRQMEKSNIQNIKSLILSNYHPLVGNFMSNDKELKISIHLNELSERLEDILTEKVMLVKSDPSNKKIPDQMDWDIDELKRTVNFIKEYDIFDAKIEKLNGNLRNLFSSIGKENAISYVESCLLKSIKPDTQLMSIEYKLQKFIEAFNYIKEIKNFLANNNRNLENINQIIKNSIKSAEEFVYQEADKTIITSYKTLKDWNGGNLSAFLSGISDYNIVELFQKSITSFAHMTDIIDSILKISSTLDFDQIPASSVEKLKYFRDEVKSYIAGKNSSLKVFEDLFLQISNWELKYRDDNIKIPQSSDYFKYEYNTFKSILISRNNAIIHKKSIEEYNKLATMFNNTLANKFPFGLNGTADEYALINFLQEYRKTRESLLADKTNDLKFKNALQDLENMNKLFTVVNGKEVVIHLNISCDVPGNKKNTSLLAENEIIFGTQNLKGDKYQNIIHKVNDRFAFKSVLVDKNDVIFLQDSKFSQNPKTLTMDYSTDWGVFKFLQDFAYKRDENNLILQMNLPIKHNNDDHLIYYILVENIPELIRKMDIL